MHIWLRPSQEVSVLAATISIVTLRNIMPNLMINVAITKTYDNLDINTESAT